MTNRREHLDILFSKGVAWRLGQFIQSCISILYSFWCSLTFLLALTFLLLCDQISCEQQEKGAQLTTTLPEWPDLAKFCHFGKTEQDFGKMLMVYLVFGKILNLLWQKYDIWRIFIVTNGQILNSFRATWSLWMLLFHSRKSDDFKSFKFDAQETDEATWRSCDVRVGQIV